MFVILGEVSSAATRPIRDSFNLHSLNIFFETNHKITVKFLSVNLQKLLWRDVYSSIKLNEALGFFQELSLFAL